eukprot:8698916-Pyramimonas_sp.AAC.1
MSRARSRTAAHCASDRSTFAWLCVQHRPRNVDAHATVLATTRSTTPCRTYAEGELGKREERTSTEAPSHQPRACVASHAQDWRP